MKKMIIIPMSFIVLLIESVFIANASSCHGGCTYDGDDLEHDSLETVTNSDEISPYVSPVIPSFVQELGFGEWLADTICVVNGTVYYYASEDLGIMRVIYDDENLLVADPALEVDSFASGCHDKFYISVVDKSRVIDFSNVQSRRSMSSLSQLLPTFTRFKNDSIAGFGHTVLYSFSVDFPKTPVRHADEIRKWLVDKIVNSQIIDEDVPDASSLWIKHARKAKGGWKYRGNIYDHHQIAKFVASIYFALKKGEYGTNDDDYPSCLFSVLNMRAVVQNDRFVTYQQCTHDYNGGIHGYYTERLISYDYEHRQEINFSYLFKPQSKQQLLEILLDVAKNHYKYHGWTPDIMSSVCVVDEDGNPTGELNFPQPGLSEEGVVFSFQPYEIDCYAAGTYHFTVPYDKVKHFMTPRGKWCTGITD